MSSLNFSVHLRVILSLYLSCNFHHLIPNFNVTYVIFSEETLNIVMSPATMSPLFSQNFGQMAQHTLGGYNNHTIRPTIILVHGGWQGPSTFSLLVRRLEKAGYSVFAPALPSTATKPALPSFDEDVKIVHNAIQSVVDTGKEVIVVMHSYGAVVGCEALRGIKVKDLIEPLQTNDDLEAGGVTKLVFLCGMVLPVGGSTWKAEKGNDPVPGFECEVSDISSRTLQQQITY